MKYLFFIFFSLPVLCELDLALPPLTAEEIKQIPPLKDEKFLQFYEIKEPPTKSQKVVFYTLNILDVYTSYEGLKNPNLAEGNVLLGKKPHLDELILQKIIIGGLIHQNASKNYMRIVNTSLGIVIMRNKYLINTTSSCPINTHVDGYNMPC